jgi:hypothetical protein
MTAFAKHVSASHRTIEFHKPSNNSRRSAKALL